MTEIPTILEGDLLIDDRETREHTDVYLKLARLMGREHVHSTRLDFGDYVFRAPDFNAADPNLGYGPLTIAIELCTVGDLVGKKLSGRLAFQCVGMLQRYDICYLMTTSPVQEGKGGYVWQPGAGNIMQFDSLMDEMCAAQAHGIKFVQCATGTVPERIHKIYKYWQKPPEEHKLFRPIALIPETGMPLGPEVDRKIQTLMTIDQVGEVTAKELALAFGSLKAIANMSQAALKTVPGVGPGTARRIYEHWNDEIPISADDVEAAKADNKADNKAAAK